MKKTLLLSALLALGTLGTAGTAAAEIFSANGVKELSIKASGDLVSARRIAREQAELAAVASVLRLKLSANPNDPKVKNALAELRTQLADNLRTSFNAEGDILTARATLQVDSNQFLDMTRSLELGSKLAGGAKVLFLIDEYYGVATRLDPSQPLVTEIDYSHDKSAMSDRSSTVASSRSASSSSASAAKGSFAAASSDKSAYAASSASSAAGRDRASFAGSDKASFSGSDRGAIAVQDGYGGSGAAARNVQASGSRDTQVAGARDTQYAAAQKSAQAGSSSSQAAVSASYSKASAAKSSSAASYAETNNDVQRQNDVVNLKVKQVFAGIDNAKPSEASLINQKLQQVVGEFGLEVTDERDFRIEGGRRLTISDITRLQKFDSYLKKASSGSFQAKYVVYGQAIMQSEGSTPSGDVLCSGYLALSSADVDTGASFAKATIDKQASGSSDQNCRASLADALARSVAETIGTKAQRDLQQGSVQGNPYIVSVYSAQRIPGKLRRDFEARLKEIAGVVEFGEGDNASDELRSWKVLAKGNFGSLVNDLVDEYIEADNSAFRLGRFERRGNKLMFCIEGKCPEQN